MLTREDTQKLAQKIFSWSTFPACEVAITETEEAYVRFANNGITNSAFSLKRTVTIRSTREQKTGVLETGDIDDASLKAAVARSEALAAIAPPDPENVEPLGPQTYPEFRNFDEATAAARSPQMIPHIRAIVDAALKSKLQAAGLFLRSASVSAVANKKGVFGFHRSTDAHLATTMRKPDGSSSGWSGKPAARIGDIEGAALAASAIEKCMTWIKPRRLEPGKYTVVLEPTATGDLVSFLRLSLDARATDEGRTFLSKKGGGTLVGDSLFPEIVTLRTDPMDPRMPALPWSSSLSPNRKVTWIEKGVVRQLAYDRYWAGKMNQQPAPQPGSLILDGSDVTLADLIRATDRGLLITHFWYIRPVNPQTLQLTGLTRDAVFLIERGKVTDPVMNLRFNESPVRLLQRAQKLGRPERVRGFEGASMIAPPMLSREFTFSSVSDAV